MPPMPEWLTNWLKLYPWEWEEAHTQRDWILNPGPDSPYFVSVPIGMTREEFMEKVERYRAEGKIFL